MIRQGILHRNAWLGLIQLKTSQASFDSITARIREAVIPLRWQVALQLLPWYIGTNITEIIIEIERVQTGVRIEKRLLKVLKAVSELKDMTLGDLLEGIVLHAFEGKPPFSEATLKEIEQFKKIYGLSLKASDSHQLKERHKR